MKKMIALMLVLMLALSCISIVACGGDGDDETGEAATSEQETQGESTPEDTDETPGDKDETSGSGSMEEAMGFDSLDDLKSYHMESRTQMPEIIPGMGATDMKVSMDVVNDPPPEAEHMVADMGMGTMEMITIGNTTWTKMFGQNKWMKSTDEDTGDEYYEEPDHMYDEFDFDSDLDYQGKEKVNGVNTKHYKVDAEVDMEMPDAQGNTQTVTAHYKGDLWIADEGNLPEVMIKEKGTSTMTMMGQEITVSSETDVTKINSNIKIGPPPPEDVMQPGEIPEFGNFDMPEFDMP